MIDITISVTKAQVAGLLCSAFEGGSNYWCEIVKYKEPLEPINLDEYNNTPFEEDVFRHIHYPLHGGAVIVKDLEENKEYELNLSTIKKGLVLFVQNHGEHAGDWLSENDDATTGDVFLQCCLFGDVVYG